MERAYVFNGEDGRRVAENESGSWREKRRRRLFVFVNLFTEIACLGSESSRGSVQRSRAHRVEIFNLTDFEFWLQLSLRSQYRVCEYDSNVYESIADPATAIRYSVVEMRDSLSSRDMHNASSQPPTPPPAPSVSSCQFSELSDRTAQNCAQTSSGKMPPIIL